MTNAYLEKLEYYESMIGDIKQATLICIKGDFYERNFDHVLVEAAWLLLEGVGNGGYPAEDWVEEIGQRMKEGMTFDEAVNDLPAAV